MLREQFANLRVQIPLMYALMLINASFLAVVTYRDVPIFYSLGMPVILQLATAARAGVWILRGFTDPTPDEIRRYLRDTIFMAAILGGAFGGWGLLLLKNAGSDHGSAIALYVFVGAMSCCYCLQAIPMAGRLVLLCGAMPVTVQLLLSGDWYLRGVAVTFLLVSGAILRTLANGYAATVSALETRAEMASLIAALQRSEEHHRYSVDLNPQIPWISDASGMVTEISPRWTELTGVDPASALGIGWSLPVHPDDLPNALAHWNNAVETGRGDLADIRFRIRNVDGLYRWFRSRAWPRLDADGNVVCWYGTLEDIEDHVVAEFNLQDIAERYHLASQASNDVIWDIKLDTDQIAWSGAIDSMLGYPEALDGTSRQWWIDRIHPDDVALGESHLLRLDDNRFTHWTQEFRVRTAAGAYINVRSRGYVVRDQAGKATRLVGSLQDITVQTRYENELRIAAHHDPLTQLPNRLLFAERLDSALGYARRHAVDVGLVVLDVDRFKTINDGMGHDTGDALLREIAARLKAAAPPLATVARLGGDEFAIILPGLDGDVVETVETLLATVSNPLTHAGRQIEVSLSAGVAIAFEDGNCAEELHKSADLALYAAKRDAPGRVRGFRRDLRDAAERQKQMLSDARTALQADCIVPFYQPKISLRTGEILGFEALLRWHHPRLGLLSPAAIHAAFEDPGVSVQITDRMLDRTIADMRDWRQRGLSFGRIAINGSPEDFRRGDFADRILDRLHRAGLPPSVIELEVTETVFLGQLTANVSTALDTLSAAGVTIALDDFGTGYASLTHLKQFPVNALKIDRSFVSRLSVAENEDAAIVGAVIGLAKTLGITTVAEGIETPAQATHLIVKGCDMGQGFLFSRPMTAAQVIDAIVDWDAKYALTLCGAANWGTAERNRHRQRYF